MSLWNFLNSVYVITLSDQTARQAVTRHELQRVGLLPKTTFFYAVKHPNGGVQGCYESHAAVIQAAQAQHPTKPILILEDDIEFTPDWETYLPKAIAFIQAAPPQSWDIFLLGHLPLKSERAGKHIQRIHCAALTHAYIVNSATLQDAHTWLQPFAGNHYDHFLLCNQCTKNQLFTPSATCMTRGTPTLQVYALKPMIAMQRHDNTSNAAKSSGMVTRTLANRKLMRALANASEQVTTPTLITCLTVLVSLFVVAVLAATIALPIVLTRRKKAMTIIY